MIGGISHYDHRNNFWEINFNQRCWLLQIYNSRCLATTASVYFAVKALQPVVRYPLWARPTAKTDKVKWHDSWNAKNPRTTANSITNRRMDRRLSRNKCKFACTSSLDLQNRLKSTVNVTILLTAHGMGYYSGESLLESTILLVKFHVRYRYITCERRLWNPLLKIPGFH